jgi:uncharacterized protein (DUF488 family)
MSIALSPAAFTVGYEGKSLPEFIGDLTSQEIRTVIDVRERAQSRKPGFSKRTLSVELARSGIEYVHFPELGSPSIVRQEYRRTGDFERFSMDYEKYALTQIACIAALIALIHVRRAAILCFEDRWDECHRKVLCDYLEHTGISFNHL